MKRYVKNSLVLRKNRAIKSAAKNGRRRITASTGGTVTLKDMNTDVIPVADFGCYGGILADALEDVFVYDAVNLDYETFEKPFVPMRIYLGSSMGERSSETAFAKTFFSLTVAFEREQLTVFFFSDFLTETVAPLLSISPISLSVRRIAFEIFETVFSGDEFFITTDADLMSNTEDIAAIMEPSRPPKKPDVAIMIIARTIRTARTIA